MTDTLEPLDGDHVLRMRGEGMTGAGILDGDYLVIRDQDTANDGDIVVATIDGAGTVRRFVRDESGLEWLKAEHDRIEPIPVDAKVKILGRVVGVLRSVK